MYKLTVIAGPNRGTSFAVQNGQTTIGRQSGNAIMLESARVSKRHCMLVYSEESEDVELRDEGSANGTFVNGALTRIKKLRIGDRISVGEFVFELVKSVARKPRAAPAVQQEFGNVVQFPGQYAGHLQGQGGAHGSQYPAIHGGMPGGGGSPDLSQGSSALGLASAPTDLKGKLLLQFDQHVMPMFYDFLFKQEWRVIMITLFVAFMIGNLLISVSPILESGKQTAIKEVGKRATFMAKQVVERNTPFLVGRAETKTEIGALDREEGVRVAVLTDLDSRILAPSNKYNQYLALGGEAKLATRARDLFRKGRETGIVTLIEDDTVAAVEPLKIYNPQQGKNVIVGMAIVSLDASLSTLDFGEMGVIYSQTLIYTGILGALILMVIYRLTLKPFQVLNDDIDKVLKGDMSQVTHEFKFEEMDQLWDVINSALTRISHSEGGGGSQAGPAPEEFVGPLKMLGDLVKAGLIVCDPERKVLFMNGAFEEISGIRFDNCIGQELASHARDQAFAVLLGDLFDRSAAGGDGVSEDFEFSGISYRVSVSAFGAMGGPVRAYVLAAEKKEG